MRIGLFLIAVLGVTLAFFFPEEWRKMADTVLEPVVRAFSKMVIEATDGV